MKKNLISALLIALILTLSLIFLCGCFFENLSFISGKLSGDSLAALEALAADEESEDSDALTNFTQINTSKGTLDGHSFDYTVTYQISEKGMHIYRKDIEDGVEKNLEVYYEIKDDSVICYEKQKNGEWSTSNVSKEQYLAAIKKRSESTDGDTRANLFDPKNYKRNGKSYKYVGSDVYYKEDKVTMYMFVDGLNVINGGIEIKTTVVPGVETNRDQAQQIKAMGICYNVSYKLIDIGSTTISFPKGKSTN